MAKQEKLNRDANGANEGDEHELVTMARRLAEIATSHGLSELIVDTKETTVTVKRGGVAMPMAVHGAPPAHISVATSDVPVRAVAAVPVVDDKSHVVTSPFVGTFYRRPNPDSPSYVTLNDKIDKGQVLCIVEAMKLMNEIEADVAGTVVGILVEDGAPVEYGQALFKIMV